MKLGLVIEVFMHSGAIAARAWFLEVDQVLGWVRVALCAEHEAGN
jgi:hypothetical protein